METISINQYYSFRSNLIHLYNDNYIEFMDGISNIMGDIIMRSDDNFRGYELVDSSNNGKDIKVRIFIENYSLNNIPTYQALVNEFISTFKRFICNKLAQIVSLSAKDLSIYVSNPSSSICDIAYIGNTIVISL